MNQAKTPYEPENKMLRLLLCGTAAAAYLFNAVFWIYMTVRIYSRQELWLSPFLTMVGFQIIMPLLLFAIGYCALRTRLPRLAAASSAVLLAISGLLCSMLLGMLYTMLFPQYGQWDFIVLSVLTLGLFIAYIIWTLRDKKKTARRLEVASVFAAITVFAYVITAVTLVKDTLWRLTNGHSVQLLLQDTALMHTVILPAVFFALALIFLRRSGKWASIHRAIVLTTIGYLLTQGVVSLHSLLTNTLPGSETLLTSTTDDTAVLLLSVTTYGAVLVLVRKSSSPK